MSFFTSFHPFLSQRLTHFQHGKNGGSQLIVWRPSSISCETHAAVACCLIFTLQSSCQVFMRNTEPNRLHKTCINTFRALSQQCVNQVDFTKVNFRLFQWLAIYQKFQYMAWQRNYVNTFEKSKSMILLFYNILSINNTTKEMTYLYTALKEYCFQMYLWNSCMWKAQGAK